jgi:hypothetical protein
VSLNGKVFPSARSKDWRGVRGGGKKGEEQFLVMQNFVYKIKSKPHDIISFGKFFYPMIQTIYYLKCLKDGVWPQMHPPLVRADIKKRYQAVDEMLSEIESDGVTWVERARLIEKLVMSEMPAFL